MSERTWEETKEILDDPYVSAETKQAVLGAYARSGDGNEAAEEYYEKYGVNPRWDLFGPPRFIDDDKIYEEAKAEAEREGYRERQVSDRLEENKSALAEAQAPGTTGGVQNSDELFDLGETALEVFEQFVPIDEEAPGDCRHIDGPINLQTDIEERFNEQRGIDFQKFLDQAQKLRDAHATLRELHETTESNLNSLYKDWTGPAANASYQKYSEDIAPNSNELLEYLEGGADVIEAAVQTVYEVCKSKIEQINDLYTPTVGSAVPDIARKVMTLARGEVEDQEQILEVAAWVDAETGSNIEATIRADDCGLNEENKVMTVNQCKEWVQTSWNTDLYDHLYKDFTRICDDAKEKVDEAWGELNEYFKGYTSEFPEGGDLGLEGPDTGNPDSGQRTPTGGGGGGGGGGTSPSTSTPPPIPEPDLPGSGQPKNPVTGEDLEIDPETGEPYPIDPETGEAIKDLGSDRDTLTVEKGDRTFEMTEPDEDGEMEISIDDGSGEPKEYKLDFGDGETGEGEAGDDDFGPRGAGGESDERVYRPGPDGKIHIEDGDLKITAERPEGPDGPTKVTVDDGTPPPTTYTLGEAKDEDAGPTGGGGAGGAGSGGADRGSPRTMPAPGENPVDDEEDDADKDVPTGGSGGGSGGTPAGGGGGIGSAMSGGPGGSAVGGGGGGEPIGDGPMSGAVPGESPTSAGLGTAPGGMAEPAVAGAPPSGDTAGGAGMAPMGGMGAAGAGGGQGGDQERTNPYRIDGGIFDNNGTEKRISGTIGEDNTESSVQFSR